jgi:hypothetical protein
MPAQRDPGSLRGVAAHTSVESRERGYVLWVIATGHSNMSRQVQLGQAWARLSARQRCSPTTMAQSAGKEQAAYRTWRSCRLAGKHAQRNREQVIRPPRILRDDLCGGNACWTMARGVPGPRVDIRLAGNTQRELLIERTPQRALLLGHGGLRVKAVDAVMWLLTLRTDYSPAGSRTTLAPMGHVGVRRPYPGPLCSCPNPRMFKAAL